MPARVIHQFRTENFEYRVVYQEDRSDYASSFVVERSSEIDAMGVMKWIKMLSFQKRRQRYSDAREEDWCVETLRDLFLEKVKIPLP